MSLSLTICNILSRIARSDKPSKDHRINSFAVLDNFADIQSWSPKYDSEWTRNGKKEYDALMVEYGYMEETDIRKNKVCEKIEIGYALDLNCESCPGTSRKRDPKEMRFEAMNKLRSIISELRSYAKYAVQIDGEAQIIFENPSNIDMLVECGVIESYNQQCIKIDSLITDFKVNYYQWPMADLADNLIIVTAQLQFCHCEKPIGDMFDYGYVKNKPKSQGAVVLCSKC